MPIARFQMPDGRIARFEVPEGTTPEQAHSMMQEHFAQPSEQPTERRPDSNGFTQGAGNLLAGLARGAGSIGATLLAPLDMAYDAIDGKGLSLDANRARRAAMDSGLQDMGANPDSMLYKGGKLTGEIAGTAGIPVAMGRAAATAGMPVIAQALGSAGFGAPAGKTAIQNAALRVGGGAAVGAAAAGSINPEDAGTGAIVGGAFGALSKPIGAAVESISRKFINQKPTMAQITSAIDDAVNKVAKDAGVDANSIPAETRAFLKNKITETMSKGYTTDAASLLRKADFDSLNIKPLAGQISRDPTQFANERNLRGVSDVQNRLTDQNRVLQGLFNEPAAGASEKYKAGGQLADVLRKYDSGKSSAVSDLYSSARGEGGRYAAVDHVAFSNAANDALDSQMLGRFLPEQARGLLNDISSGKLPLNVNNLVQIDSVLSSAQRSADNAGAKAIGAVRDALNNAPISNGAGADAKAAFDAARKAARARFAEIDSNPALKAVVEGKDIADDFVSKFVIRGKTDDVQKLAELLRKESPETLRQAKAQMADEIKRAAFGENITKDSVISPDRLAKKLREFGSDKMAAFFTPEEIARYQTASRVAAYIEKHPNAAPVNTSNTLVAQLMNSPLSKAAELIPLKGAVIGAAKAATGAVKNQMNASSALNAEVATAKMALNPEQRKLLAKALGASSSAISSQFAQ